MIRALLICLALGALSFIAGQSLPRKWFDYRAFPYRDFGWERGGRIYEAIKVRSWKDILPDMSRFVPGMVKKKAALARTPQAMETLVRETCVAEIVHWALIFVCCPLLIFACGKLGTLYAALYALGNLLFIAIQRYNRPRLCAILQRMTERNNR